MFHSKIKLISNFKVYLVKIKSIYFAELIFKISNDCVLLSFQIECSARTHDLQTTKASSASQPLWPNQRNALVRD